MGRVGTLSGLGEAAALRVSDIDFLRRTLAVRRQVQRAAGGVVEIRPPKYGSERDGLHRRRAGVRAVGAHQVLVS
jgi:hypothetical protein